MPKLSVFNVVTLGLLLAGAGAACADEMPPPAAASAVAAPAAVTMAPDIPAAQADRVNAWNDVVQLGEIKVEGDRDANSRRIIAGLKVIKSALKAKLTNDPADDKVVVCRMNYDTGSHVMAHLMCATNGTMRIYREQLHAAQMAATTGQADGAVTQELENMSGHFDRKSYFNTRINASELQKLLLQVQCDGCANSGLVVGNN